MRIVGELKLHLKNVRGLFVLLYSIHRVFHETRARSLLRKVRLVQKKKKKKLR